MYEVARDLRKNPTHAERILWERLRARKLGGYKFLRQRPLSFVAKNRGGDFVIADFYCHAAKLVIEVDGPSHDKQKDYDRARDEKLREMGFNTLRFHNEEVLHDLMGVLERILQWLQTSPPLEKGGAGGGY